MLRVWTPLGLDCLQAESERPRVRASLLPDPGVRRGRTTSRTTPATATSSGSPMGRLKRFGLGGVTRALACRNRRRPLVYLRFCEAVAALVGVGGNGSRPAVHMHGPAGPPDSVFPAPWALWETGTRAGRWLASGALAPRGAARRQPVGGSVFCSGAPPRKQLWQNILRWHDGRARRRPILTGTRMSPEGGHYSVVSMGR